MPSQNLISATLTQEKKARILEALAVVTKELDFLITLQPNEIKGIYKPGNGYVPFIEKAHQTLSSHPEIMPDVFDIIEFEKDYSLYNDLVRIVIQVDELADSLHDTLTAAGSDSLTGALEVYAAVKQHRDKVPGLNITAEEMAVFFPRARKKTQQPEEQPSVL